MCVYVCVCFIFRQRGPPDVGILYAHEGWLPGPFVTGYRGVVQLVGNLSPHSLPLDRLLLHSISLSSASLSST